MWNIDLKRLEKQLFVYNPKLRSESLEFRNRMCSGLEKRLQGSRPIVFLQRLDEGEHTPPNHETKEFSEDEPVRARVVQSDYDPLEDISDEESKPLSVIADRQKNLKIQREKSDKTLALPMDDSTPNEIEKQQGCRQRKRSHRKVESCRDSKWRKWLENSPKRERTSKCSVTSEARADFKSAGVSLFVTPRSHSAPLTITMQVPSGRVIDREIKFNLHMEAEELSQHLVSTKSQHNITSASGRARGRRRSINNQSQKNVECVVAPPTPQQEEEALSRLLSDVLVEPMNALETWQATNAISNINNNISDNYNVDISGSNSEAIPHSTSTNCKKRRKSTKTEVENGGAPKIRRPRKLKVKSDLARYVEQFGNNCGSASSSMSPQLVSSTTQNLDTIEPISYYYDGGQLIPIPNVSNYTIGPNQILQEDLNINVPFEDFVKYINSSNNDVDSNAIARVLDGGNTMSGLNNRNGVFYSTGKCPAAFEVAVPNQSILRLPANAHTNTQNSLVNHHEVHKLPALPVPMLTGAARECNSNDVVQMMNEDVAAEICLPLNLSIKAGNQNNAATSNEGIPSNVQTPTIAEETDKDDQLIHAIETNSFKAALDMPLLDMENGALVQTTHEPSTQPNEATSSNSTVADFEYLANNLPDEQMNAATAAATKHTADILSQFEFFDQSSKELFKTLLDVNCAVADEQLNKNAVQIAKRAMVDEIPNKCGALEDKLSVVGVPPAIKMTNKCEADEIPNKSGAEEDKLVNEGDLVNLVHTINYTSGKESNSSEAMDDKVPNKPHVRASTNENSTDLMFDTEIKESSDNVILDIFTQIAPLPIDLDDGSSNSVNLKEPILNLTASDETDYSLNYEKCEHPNACENIDSLTTDFTFVNVASNNLTGAVEKSLDYRKPPTTTNDREESHISAATEIFQLMENATVLEIDAKVTHDWLDFSDDALSLSASSIGSPDECSADALKAMDEVTDAPAIESNSTAEICMAPTTPFEVKFKINKLHEEAAAGSSDVEATCVTADEFATQVSSAPDVRVNNRFSTIQAIFGVLCCTYLVGECTAGAACKLSHQLRDPHVVKSDLESLSLWELSLSYKFVYNHGLLYRHYFSVFCKIYGSRKNRSMLLHMIIDCARYLECPQFLLHIYYSLIQCGLNRVNACRMVLNRCHVESVSFINVLVNMIIETDCTMFCTELERFVAGGVYKFDTEVLQKMAPTVSQSKDERLANIFLRLCFALNPEEIQLVRASPDFLRCLESITALGHGGVPV